MILLFSTRKTQVNVKSTVNKLIGKTFGNGCKIIAHSHTVIMKNGKPQQYFLVECHCGKRDIISSNTVWRRKECFKCGHKTRAKTISGPNHWNYNPNLTDQQRFENRRHSIYRISYKSIYLRDNFTCKKCSKNTRKPIAHHLNGWDGFPEQRYDPNNIVTLCSNCHNNFHAEFGYGKNTKEQFDVWLNRTGI